MAKKPTMEKYVRKALKLGARHAKVISAGSVETAQWVRIKCQYGCGGYGERLTCPPYTPVPEETAQMLDEYKTAILIHGDDHTNVTEVASKLEREAFLDGYHKAFGMGSGPCRLCKECNLEEEACRRPYQARPAMEACGIDVFETARNNGFPIQVVRDKNCEQNCYGIVLVE